MPDNLSEVGVGYVKPMETTGTVNVRDVDQDQAIVPGYDLAVAVTPAEDVDQDQAIVPGYDLAVELEMDELKGNKVVEVHQGEGIIAHSMDRNPPGEADRAPNDKSSGTHHTQNGDHSPGPDIVPSDQPEAAPHHLPIEAGGIPQTFF